MTNEELRQSLDGKTTEECLEIASQDPLWDEWQAYKPTVARPVTFLQYKELKDD